MAPGPRFRDEEVAAKPRRPGAALGLTVTDEGGDVLLVEAAYLLGRGTLHVTGTAGPMMREAANVAMTWVGSHAERLAGAAGLDDSTDVHVHLVEAARWKDGPSAGVALAAALFSALTGHAVRCGLAVERGPGDGATVPPERGGRGHRGPPGPKARDETAGQPAAGDPAKGRSTPSGRGWK